MQTAQIPVCVGSWKSLHSMATREVGHLMRHRQPSIRYCFLIKKPKNRLLPIFSPDFTLNRQIWLFYAEKWIFLKKLGTLLKV